MVIKPGIIFSLILLACMAAKTVFGIDIGRVTQHPATVSLGSTVSLLCTVSGVSHRCTDGTIDRETAKATLEWHTPTWSVAISDDDSSQNFYPLSLLFTADCTSGTLTSNLTFTVENEFKSAPYQCALVIDYEHPLFDTTSLPKIWNQAVFLKVSDTEAVTCPPCNTECVTEPTAATTTSPQTTACPKCTDCSDCGGNTTQTTAEPCVNTITAKINVTNAKDMLCTVCQQECGVCDGTSIQSTSIFSVVITLLLGLFLVTIINLF